MSRQPPDACTTTRLVYMPSDRRAYHEGAAPRDPSSDASFANYSLQRPEYEGAGFHAAFVTCHVEAKQPAHSIWEEGALDLAVAHVATNSWDIHERKHKNTICTHHHHHHTTFCQRSCQNQQRQQQEQPEKQQQQQIASYEEHHHQSCWLSQDMAEGRQERQQQQQVVRTSGVCLANPNRSDSAHSPKSEGSRPRCRSQQQHTPCTTPTAVPTTCFTTRSGSHHNHHLTHRQQQHLHYPRQQEQLEQQQHLERERQDEKHRPRPGTSSQAPQQSSSLRCLSLSRRLVSLLLVLLMRSPTRSLVAASALTGSDFPFENCVQEQRFSPFYASLYSYRENRTTNTSTICVQVRLLPTCAPGKYRCCNTAINKLKVFPALNCRGSVASAIVNGNTVTSFYWEEHDGFDILKVTPLLKFMPTRDDAEGAILCLNLKTPCWTIQQFAYGGEVLEYALYDKKADNYECCPCGTVGLPSSEPGFPSLPPPKRTPPLAPGSPLTPAPSAPKTPLKRKQPPPPLPPSPRPPPPRPPSPRPPPPGKPPPSPLPPSPPPPSKRRSPPPSLPAPPSPRPPKKRTPPPPPPVGCDITVTLRRSAAANQGFVDSTCSLYGTLTLIPLKLPADTAAAISTTCVISDPSNMVMTLTMQPADAAALIQLYGSDAEQRATALALLGLNDCGGNFARIESSCAGDGTPVIIECESPPPPPPSPQPPPRPPPPKSKSAKSPPPSSSSPPPTRSPPPAPPPQAPPPRIFVYGDSAYLLFYSSSTFPDAESTCVILGGHLAAIATENENNYVVSSIVSDLPEHGTLNVWFGLYVRTDKTAAIPGYNTDGTRMSYTPDEFEYDRTRSVTRYYMLSCDADVGSCGWRYSLEGATDLQPSYLCEFTTSQT